MRFYSNCHEVRKANDRYLDIGEPKLSSEETRLLLSLTLRGEHDFLQLDV